MAGWRCGCVCCGLCGMCGVGERCEEVEGRMCRGCWSVQVFQLSSLQIFSEDELEYLLCGRRELWTVRAVGGGLCFGWAR